MRSAAELIMDNYCLMTGVKNLITSCIYMLLTSYQWNVLVSEEGFTIYGKLKTHKAHKEANKAIVHNFQIVERITYLRLNYQQLFTTIIQKAV